MRDNQTVTLEEVQLTFKNFEGRETEYNAAGNRNFSVILPPNVADQLHQDGWNVKERKRRDEDSEPEYHLSVAVGFRIRPPRLVLINNVSKTRTILDEDTCEILDWADIIYADLIIRARPWSVRGATGIKAYLQTLFAIIREDDLELKYSRDPQWALPDRGNVIDGEIVERYELEAGRG